MFGTRQARQTIAVIAALLGLGIVGWTSMPRTPAAPVVATSPIGAETGARVAGEVEPPITNAADEPDATPVAPSDAVLPSFDVVRVDAQGRAVVAGRSEIGSDVVVRLDGQAIATSHADAEGKFASLFDLPLGDAPKLLTIEATDIAGRLHPGAERVIVAPVDPVAQAHTGGPDIAVAETLKGPEGPFASVVPMAQVPDEPDGSERPTRLDVVAVRTAAVSERPSAADPEGRNEQRTDRPEDAGRPKPTDAIEPFGRLGTELGDAPLEEAMPLRNDAAIPETATLGQAPDLTRPSTDVGRGPTVPIPRDGVDAQTASADGPPAAAPRLLRTGPNGLSVMPRNATRPDYREDLGIDAITYDASGEVQIAGHGLRDMRLRIYLDNRPIQVAQIDDHGAWTTLLPDIDSGLFTLRVDALAPDGSVVSRIETPFQRTAPDVAAAARRDGLSAITVQPGYTLWAISEGYFGEGIRYVQIFEENRDHISDPNLIFPGQIFALPKD